jgi:hypothetical protein
MQIPAPTAHGRACLLVSQPGGHLVGVVAAVAAQAEMGDPALPGRLTHPGLRHREQLRDLARSQQPLAGRCGGHRAALKERLVSGDAGAGPLALRA